MTLNLRKVRETKKAKSPIYIIGGFLGSGKTTLLKRFLHRELERGIKPGVLMNEFGTADVDGTSLCDRAHADDVHLRSILNGCMCCDLSGSVEENLHALLKKVGGAPVFIETTGLASTMQVVESVRTAMLNAAPQIARGYLMSSIVMIDTPRFEATLHTWSEGINHLRCVDNVILNKIEKVDGRQADFIESQVRTINPRARVRRTSFADIELATLARSHISAREQSVPSELVDVNGADSTLGFRSVTVRILYPIDLERLEALLSRYRVSVVRAKGFVRVTTEPGLQEIQWVPGTLDVAPYRSSQHINPHVVIIGRRAPWNRFFEHLDSCIPTPKSRHR